MPDMTAEIDEIVMNSNSLRGALFALRGNEPLLGGCHIGYEFIVRDKGHIRSDLIAETTLPNSFWDLYHANGGSTLDPVLSRLSSDADDFRLDLSAASHRVGGRGTFFDALSKLGCVSIATYSLPRSEIIGKLAFTVMEDQDQRNRSIDPSRVIEIARRFHIALRKHGHIKRLLRLTRKECATLAALTSGQAAADIAAKEQVTVRSVEKRLQNVRSKLQARTTVEAVFKAVAYGVLDDG